MMRKRLAFVQAAVAGLLLCTSGVSGADEASDTAAGSAKKGAARAADKATATGDRAAAGKAADNTAQNRPERQAGEPTAEQQKNNKSDLEITRLIRRALVTDKALSLYAHNVKIITQQGKVTLKGPVRSEDEKRVVEQKATEVATAANVQSELTVAPKK